MKSSREIMQLWATVIDKIRLNHPNYYQLLKNNNYKTCVRKRQNNSFGWADHNKREVVINIFLHGVSEDAAILDTMLHEIAHAVDFCQRGTSDHGKAWQRIASELGAISQATSKIAKQVKYKYVCVYKKNEEDFKILRGFHRKPPRYLPNAIMSDTFMKGHKEESLGKVWLYTWEKWVTICAIKGKSPYKEDN